MQVLDFPADRIVGAVAWVGSWTATLSVAAFDFATRLPRLTRLGLQDVSITPAEVRELRGRLPGVDVG
jgi:hypothetical protein